MTDTLVSCILPTFNGETYLGEALDSVFAQTYRPIEVIVVDDGSTDGTEAMVKRYPNPVQLMSQPNSGPVVARNNGMRLAKGSFFAFLDHDDLWVPNKLSLQLAAFSSDPDLGACFGHVREFRVDASGNLVDRGEPVAGYITGTFVMSRRALGLIGEFNETLQHSDTAEWTLRARHSALGERLLPEVLLRKRRHEKNRSQLMNESMHQEFLRVFHANLAHNRKASSAGRGSST